MRPIGIPDYGWEMNDEKAWHFVATEDKSGRVIGCVALVPLNADKTKSQLIQMAVDTKFQRKGTGRLLVNALLNFCKINLIREVSCHAQLPAVPFYEKMGFEVFGDRFTEAGIEHCHMRIVVP